MGENTRIYNRWQGYTVADCRCEHCLFYAGKKRPCPLDICCCKEERQEALQRKQGAVSGTTAREKAVPCLG